MNNKVLITGGAGFIGSNLALKLIERGYSVRVLDNLSEQIHGNSESSFLYNSIKDKVDFVHGDVTNPKDWEKALTDQEVVVHFAAETGTGQSMYEVSKYFNVNVNGTAHLIDLLTNKKHDVKKIVVASSRAIYGEGKYLCKKHGSVYPDIRSNDDLQAGMFNCRCPFCNGDVTVLPTDEESAIHPNSYYGLTKQVQEQMVLLAGKALGIESIALRYQNVYGPGQSLSNPYTGILAIFSTLIRNNQHINVFEDGKESRDFVYIDDVINATLLSIEAQNIKSNVFNVGSGEPVSVDSIAEKLIDIYKSKVNMEIKGNYRVGDIRHNYADISKIQVELGFKPKYKFDDGLQRFTGWVKDQSMIDNNFEESLNEMKYKGLLK